MRRFLAAVIAALTLFSLSGCAKVECPTEPVTPGQGEEPAAPMEPELTPEEVLLRQERQTALQAALEQLSAGERLLFYRKYYYLPSTAQIALEPRLTERAVEGRLYRLKRQLRKLPGGDERS